MTLIKRSILRETVDYTKYFEKQIREKKPLTQANVDMKIPSFLSKKPWVIGDIVLMAFLEEMDNDPAALLPAGNLRIIIFKYSELCLLEKCYAYSGRSTKLPSFYNIFNYEPN